MFEKIAKWLEVGENRLKVYNYLRFGIAPLVTATGVITEDLAGIILTSVASLLLVSGTSLAAQNVDK